jgi:hypothetical protein
VLVAEETRTHRLDAPRPHRLDHRLRHVDSDDARYVRRDREGEGPCACTEIDDGAGRSDAELEQRRDVLGPVGRRLLVVGGDVLHVEVLRPDVGDLVEPPAHRTFLVDRRIR